MSIPIIQPISGQGGNIRIANTPLGSNFIIQVRNWIVYRIFENPDVTTTGSGGWGENKRVLARWHGQAEWPLDANRMANYEGVQLINGIYVPYGLAYPVPGIGTFQIGAAGTPLEPGAPVAMQYTGRLNLQTTQTRNPATNVVEYNITFLGTGPFIGPSPGLLS